MANSESHRGYGVDVQVMTLRVKCDDHEYQVDGLQEGPVVCPICGEPMTLTWSVKIEPKSAHPFVGLSGEPTPYARIALENTQGTTSTTTRIYNWDDFK